MIAQCSAGGGIDLLICASVHENVWYNADELEIVVMFLVGFSLHNDFPIGHGVILDHI